MRTIFFILTKTGQNNPVTNRPVALFWPRLHYKHVCYIEKSVYLPPFFYTTTTNCLLLNPASSNQQTDK